MLPQYSLTPSKNSDTSSSSMSLSPPNRDNQNGIKCVLHSTCDSLENFSLKSGYSVHQENGQRKLGGPPPNWTGPPPPKGCEIFVGHLPRDIFEDELLPVFQMAGQIYEMRLMMDFSGTNRGYCFVTYSTRAEARKAVRDLDRYEIRPQVKIGVTYSIDNCRLYIGQLSRDRNRQEILDEISRLVEGVKDVLVFPSSVNASKNRGFAFVEFENHRLAALAKKRAITEMWGQPVIIDWAEPEPPVDEDVMLEVRILYVRNLPPCITEDTIKEIFETALDQEDCVERVKKIKDFAFVHFYKREDALKGKQKIDGKLIHGNQVEVALAKPSQHHKWFKNQHASLKNDQTVTVRKLVNESDVKLLPSQIRGMIQYLENLCSAYNLGTPEIYCDSITVGSKTFYESKVVIPDMIRRYAEYIFQSPEGPCSYSSSAIQKTVFFTLGRIKEILCRTPAGKQQQVFFPPESTISRSVPSVIPTTNQSVVYGNNGATSAKENTTSPLITNVSPTAYTYQGSQQTQSYVMQSPYIPMSTTTCQLPNMASTLPAIYNVNLQPTASPQQYGIYSYPPGMTSYSPPTPYTYLPSVPTAYTDLPYPHSHCAYQQ